MAEKKNQLLNITLVLFAISTLGYGIIYLFFPEFEIESSGSVAFPAGWIRFVGPIYLSLGIGTVLVLRKPAKQGIFVTSMCIGSFMLGLTLLYTAMFEYEDMGNPLRTVIPAIFILIISLMFFISLRKSKEILW